MGLIIMKNTIKILVFLATLFAVFPVETKQIDQSEIEYKMLVAGLTGAVTGSIGSYLYTSSQGMSTLPQWVTIGLVTVAAGTGSWLTAQQYYKFVIKNNRDLIKSHKKIDTLIELLANSSLLDKTFNKEWYAKYESLAQVEKHLPQLQEALDKLSANLKIILEHDDIIMVSALEPLEKQIDNWQKLLDLRKAEVNEILEKSAAQK